MMATTAGQVVINLFTYLLQNTLWNKIISNIYNEVAQNLLYCKQSLL